MPHALRLRTAPAPSHGQRAAHRADRGLRAWWARNVVCMDPHPETGLLDLLDRETAEDRFRPSPFDGQVQRVA
ncbi:MAG: hypothetical protein M3Y71_18350 [Actinomycetota bacterium]|nr:hypothetical protein [Actinomycetota bacterium]